MLANGVKETTNTTGTGTVTLSGVTGYPRFSDALGVDTLVDYAIRSGDNFEWGVGKIETSNTLARSIIRAKFDSGVYVESPATPLSLAGTSEVFCTVHATSFVKGGSAAIITPANWRLTSALSGHTTAVAQAGFFQEIYAYPFLLLSATRATGLSVECTTAIESSAVMLGLYDLGGDGKPGRLIINTAEISTGTTGFKSASVPPTTIPPGLYWAAILVSQGDSPWFRSMRSSSVIGLSGADMFTRLLFTGNASLPGSLSGGSSTFVNSTNPQIISIGIVTS